MTSPTSPLAAARCRLRSVNSLTTPKRAACRELIVELEPVEETCRRREADVPPVWERVGVRESEARERELGRGDPPLEGYSEEWPERVLDVVEDGITAGSA